MSIYHALKRQQTDIQFQKYSFKKSAFTISVVLKVFCKNFLLALRALISTRAHENFLPTLRIAFASMPLNWG